AAGRGIALRLARRAERRRQRRAQHHVQAAVVLGDKAQFLDFQPQLVGEYQLEALGVVQRAERRRAEGPPEVVQDLCGRLARRVAELERLGVLLAGEDQEIAEQR